MGAMQRILEQSTFKSNMTEMDKRVLNLFIERENKGELFTEVNQIM